VVGASATRCGRFQRCERGADAVVAAATLCGRRRRGEGGDDEVEPWRRGFSRRNGVTREVTRWGRRRRCVGGGDRVGGSATECAERRRGWGSGEGVGASATEWRWCRGGGGGGDGMGAGATARGERRRGGRGGDVVGSRGRGGVGGVGVVDRSQKPCGGCTSGEGSACFGHAVQMDGAGAFETPDGARSGCGRVVTRHEPGRRERTGERERCRCSLYHFFYSIQLRIQAHVWSLLLPPRRRQCSKRRSRRIRLNGTPAGTKRTRYWWQLQAQQTSMKRLFPTSQSI